VNVELVKLPIDRQIRNKIRKNIRNIGVTDTYKIGENLEVMPILERNIVKMVTNTLPKIQALALLEAEDVRNAIGTDLKNRHNT